MPDDVEWWRWLRPSGGERLFTGRRSHRRRAAVPRAALAGLAVILAGGALMAGLADEETAPPDRPPAPDDQALPAPAPEAWAPAPPTSAAPSAGSPPSSAAPGSATPGTTPVNAAPPVRAAAPGEVLELSRGPVPAVVDLAAEGSRDWVHWAEANPFSTERRRGGGFAILEGTPGAPRERHTAGAERFRWTGGTPVDSSTGSRTGVRTCGTGSAFTLSAPAGRAPRTLRLYVGAWQAKGVLSARLSTGGAPVTEVLDSPGAVGTAVFTVTYQAPRDGRLELSWSTGRAYGAGCSGVALQAATLR